MNIQDNNNLQITCFGGVDKVTKNMFVYETNREAIIVDCGVGFPDEPDASEEELQIPDFSPLLNKRRKIKGIFITHAHFDHYGAVPHLLNKIGFHVPIYCSMLTASYIKLKTEEFGSDPKRLQFHYFSPKKQQVSFNDFRVNYIEVTHSVPEALGFVIETPMGNVFHISDFKFDWTPVTGKPFDLAKLIHFAGKEKPLLLLSDCLGATKVGYTHSEADIKQSFIEMIFRAKGLVLMTTISSNVSRIKQMVLASARTGRKVAILGRSMEKTVMIARQLGYFSSLKKHFVRLDKIKILPRRKLTCIVAGCYGQKGSALSKISQKKHSKVKIEKGDVVIFSADPSPPGVVVNVNAMIDNLLRHKAIVHYYDLQENLYVSGHGASEELKMLCRLVNADYVMPIGGDYRHMYAYSQLAQSLGYPEEKIFLLEEKQQTIFNSRRHVIVKGTSLIFPPTI